MQNHTPLVAAVTALAALLVACGGGVREQPGLVTFRDTYRLESAGACTRADLSTVQQVVPHAPGIIGVAPSPSPGVRHPLLVFAGGTLANYAAPDVQEWLAVAAERGFVAASIEYDNFLPGDCGSIVADATCAFDGAQPDSALGRLCARADVDCGLGVVLMGHSQGFQLTALARNFDMRVRAVVGLGANCDYSQNVDGGICNPEGAANEQCLIDANTAIAGDRMRLIVGDREEYGDQAQWEHVTSKTCAADTLDCLSADGSGWFRIPSSEVEDYHGDARDPDHTGWGADHCFWINSEDGAWCRGNATDVNWLPPGALSWSLATQMDWLARYIGPANVPQKIDSGAIISTGEFVRDQKLVDADVSDPSTAPIDASAAGAGPEDIYRSHARVAAGRTSMTYTLDGVGASSARTVRLHFAETLHTEVGARRFHVRINGAVVESDLDVLAVAGGPNVALVRDHPVVADEGGVVTIELENGAADVAMVSGVEVF